MSEAAKVEATWSDVEYRNIDGRSLLARLYMPPGVGPFPAVVAIHGGAWVSGDRLKDEVFNVWLANSGIAVMAIDMRKPPEAAFPAAALDVGSAIRWLKSQAKALSIDSECIGGVGCSSGGHLLLLNALRPSYYGGAPSVRPAEPPEIALKFGVACWPIVDPLRRYQMARLRKLEKLVLAHEAFWTDQAEMKSGSPQFLLDSGSFESLPPLLIVQGTADANIDESIVADFARAYGEAGGLVEYASFSDAPHDFIVKDIASSDSREALCRIAAFVSQHAERF